MNKLLPKLKKHLDRNGVETGLYTLKWFFQCFLDRVSSVLVNNIKYTILNIFKFKLIKILV